MIIMLSITVSFYHRELLGLEIRGPEKSVLSEPGLKNQHFGRSMTK